MAPRTRYPAERILDAALAQTRAAGIATVSARTIAAALGCSTAPVFTAFASMEALHEALLDRMMELFVARASEASHADPLLAAGAGWLAFALAEPRLYEAVFLTVHPFHAKWGRIRRQLADRMGDHPRYANLPAPARFALVGRASIVLHGLGLELWSGRLPAHDLDRLLMQLVNPVIEAALVQGWHYDLHTPPPPDFLHPKRTP